MAEQLKQYGLGYKGDEIKRRLGLVPTLETRLSVLESGSGDKRYTHTQSSIATTWEVNHNLGKRPAVSIIDRDGMTVFADINYIDDNTLTITFGSPTAGHAYCN